MRCKVLHTYVTRKGSIHYRVVYTTAKDVRYSVFTTKVTADVEVNAVLTDGKIDAMRVDTGESVGVHAAVIDKGYTSYYVKNNAGFNENSQRIVDAVYPQLKLIPGTKNRVVIEIEESNIGILVTARCKQLKGIEFEGELEFVKGEFSFLQNNFVPDSRCNEFKDSLRIGNLVYGLIYKANDWVDVQRIKIVAIDGKVISTVVYEG